MLPSTDTLSQSRKIELDRWVQALVRVPLVREFETFLRFIDAPPIEDAHVSPRSSSAESEPERDAGSPAVELEPDTPPRRASGSVLAAKSDVAISEQPPAEQTKEILRFFYEAVEPSLASDGKIDRLIDEYQQLAAEQKEKKGALSLVHQITHFPKDPNCPICNNVKRKRARCPVKHLERP